jgi:hypothetical protein
MAKEKESYSVAWWEGYVRAIDHVLELEDQ